MINEITLPLATNEEEVQNYYERVNEQMGVFQLEQQTLGNHTYYRWQAQMKEEVTFVGRMDIPSVRLYFVTRTYKGMAVQVDGRNCISKAGTHNIFFGKEECLGKDLLHKDDIIEVITVAISAEQFAQIATQYPETFMAWYQRYERGGNFILSPEQSLPTDFAMQTALDQLQHASLLGKAARPYAGTFFVTITSIRTATATSIPILQNPNRRAEDVRSARPPYGSVGRYAFDN